MQLESMASLRTILPLLTLLLVLLVSTSEAREFVVGGDHCSWEISAPTPGSECLNEWAKANRFRVGDTLLFEYDPEDGSVLRVTKDAYEKCNTTAPLAKYDDGRTKLELNKSGSFYFIGGKNRECELDAQKLAVTVVPHETLHLHLKHATMRVVQAPTPNPNTTTPSALMAPSPNDGAALGLKSGFMAILVGVGTVMWMVLF